jgi:hypothetical protein
MIQARTEEESKLMLASQLSKYDKRITTVLRTMNFNSVKKYIDSGGMKINYLNIIKLLKSDPNLGVAGIEEAINELKDSMQYKSLKWLDVNCNKYMMAKDNENLIATLINNVFEWSKDLTKIPGVIDASITMENSNNRKRKSPYDPSKQTYLNLKITYDSTIIMAGETDYQIELNRPITQEFYFKMPEYISPGIIKSGNVEDFKKEIITKEALRYGFQFNGPCMYTPNNNDYAHGCLGNRNDEYNDIIDSKNIDHLITFITGWATLYTTNANPHRSPSHLIRRSNYKYLGLPHEAAKDRVNTDFNIHCAVYHIKTRRQNNIPLIIPSIEERGKTEDDYCKSCVLTECDFNLAGNTSNVNVAATPEQVPVEVPSGAVSTAVKQLLVMHERLINSEMKDHPILDQIDYLRHDIQTSEREQRDKFIFLKPNHNKFLGSEYLKLLKVVNLTRQVDKDLIQESYEKQNTLGGN